MVVMGREVMRKSGKEVFEENDRKRGQEASWQGMGKKSEVERRELCREVCIYLKKILL